MSSDGLKGNDAGESARCDSVELVAMTIENSVVRRLSGACVSAQSMGNRDAMR